MSEHVLRILLSELTVIRVVCQNPRCGAVIEAPLESLGRVFHNVACPICKADYDPHKHQHGAPLGQLANAIAALATVRDQCEVEFVVKAPDPST